MDPWTEWTTAEKQAPAATEDKPLFPAETGEGVGGGAAVLEQPIKRGRGRPAGSGSTFTQAKADALCSLIAGGKTMTGASKILGIPLQTVQEWRSDHEDFAGQLASARDVGYDVMADECLEIAAETPYMDDKGKPDVSPQKLKIETRVKLLSLWSKRYREKEADTPPDVTVNVGVQVTNTIVPMLAFDAVRQRIGSAATVIQDEQ